MSLKRKLLIATIATTGLAVLILTLMSIAKETLDWRGERGHELSILASAISNEASLTLGVESESHIAPILSRLTASDTIAGAAIYDGDGNRLFATGSLDTHSGVDLALSRTGLFAPVTVEQPIMRDGRRLGTVYLQADAHALFSDMVSDGLVTLTGSALAFILAIYLFLGLRRGITRSIEDLSATMQEVSRDKNYKLRAGVSEEGEIGLLAATFNEMLTAIEERDDQLGQHRLELEATVEQRTARLNEANAALQTELSERTAAQDALHAHDAMLKSVTKAATELLGVLKIDDAIASVLELMGQTLGVSRIHLAQGLTHSDGHLHAHLKYEWCAPGFASVMTDPLFQDVDITAFFPHSVASNLLGEPLPEPVDGMPQLMKEKLRADGVRAALVVPVHSDGKYWGVLVFMDTSPATREWSWAETDTLKTLAGLLGAAISRARVVKELADANTIVQNSPTVLYRLKGEPSLPLTYVSHNITKFGYDPKKLIGAGPFWPAVHPDDRSKVQAALANLIAKDGSAATVEFRMLLPAGGFRWVENRCTPVRDEVGRLIEVEGIIIDITERKIAEEKIAQLARTDALSGLANRSTFVDRLHQAFLATKRGAPGFAVLYLDLDHFKDINDTRGHPAGDALLREAANRLLSIVRETDTVARLGGDEFAILQSHVDDPTDASTLASKVCASLSAPYLIESNQLHVSASIGISLYSPEIAGADAMMAQADLALYRAKDDGRNQYRFHSDELDQQANDRVMLAEELRHALEKHQIEVYYQPEVELLTGNIVGMEALMRWNHPTRGVLPAGDFIHIAEETGVIHPLGQVVLNAACRQMKEWREQGIAPPAISINVSLAQLKTGSEFVKNVTDVLMKYELPAETLELDVTESVLAQATLAQNDVLDRLRQLGVQIALDHFGTEYSSFDYLRTYHVSHLKMAHEFIDHASADPIRSATVRAIIGLARELGIQVIAEGVETKEQRALLVSLGSATQGQGFYFSGPVPPAEASELLRRRTLENVSRSEGAA